MGDYWEDNGFIKPQAYVVCAACRYGDILIVGARHFDSVMRKQLDQMDKELRPKAGSQWEQGFINQFGEFMSREHALLVAKLSCQPLDMERNGGNGKDLYSEGLY